MSPLEKAIKIIASGNQSVFVKKVNEQIDLITKETGLSISPLTQQLVSSWVTKRKPCAARYCAIVADLSDGALSFRDLRPDLFPFQFKKVVA